MKVNNMTSKSGAVEQILFENENVKVMKVYVNGHFLYTTTYTKDKEGFCNKMIRVYRDGTVEIQ